MVQSVRMKKARLILAFLWLLLPASARAQFTFFIYNDAITITGYTGPGGNVDIPASINGYPVTTILDDVFWNNTNIVNVTIPNSVNNILDYTFQYCSGLTNVTIPNSVTSIGDYAFANCYGLKNITIPSSITNIGNYTFQYCSGLTNVTIPNNATSIGDYAFDACFSLQNVTIPNGVISIGNFAFRNCSLKSVTIPYSVTSIGISPFGNNSSLTSITVNAANPNYASLGGVLFNKTLTTLIDAPGGMGTVYVIPSSVTNVGDYAFYGCFRLRTVTIPNSVTSIGNYAFESCEGLTNVTIPNTITNIGTYAFQFCARLHQAYFQGNAPTVNGGSGSADSTVFSYLSGTVYYVPGTTSWGATFGGWPTALWNPQIQTTNSNFGVKTNRFGFTLTGTTNIPIVIEASTNLSGVWTPLLNGTLTNGAIYFTDPQWTNYPQRFYRVRSP
jgi:hypothetical protein